MPPPRLSLNMLSAFVFHALQAGCCRAKPPVLSDSVFPSRSEAPSFGSQAHSRTNQHGLGCQTPMSLVLGQSSTLGQWGWEACPDHVGGGSVVLPPHIHTSEPRALLRENGKGCRGGKRQAAQGLPQALRS